MKTLAKLRFNKKFQEWIILTAACDKDGIKIQKYGNDWSLYDKCEKQAKLKGINFFKNNEIDVIWV